MTFGSAAPQTFTSAGGNPSTAPAFDPIAGTSEACKTVTAEEEPDTANYTTTSSGFTHARAADGARDDRHDGRRSARSPRGCGTCCPAANSAWSAAASTASTKARAARSPSSCTATATASRAGDTVKLQLLGRDAPYYRASNGVFSVEASNVTVTLPTG